MSSLLQMQLILKTKKLIEVVLELFVSEFMSTVHAWCVLPNPLTVLSALVMPIISLCIPQISVLCSLLVTGAKTYFLCSQEA